MWGEYHIDSFPAANLRKQGRSRHSPHPNGYLLYPSTRPHVPPPLSSPRAPCQRGQPHLPSRYIQSPSSALWIGVCQPTSPARASCCKALSGSARRGRSLLNAWAAKKPAAMHAAGPGCGCGCGGVGVGVHELQDGRCDQHESCCKKQQANTASIGPRNGVRVGI